MSSNASDVQAYVVAAVVVVKATIHGSHVTQILPNLPRYKEYITLREERPHVFRVSTMVTSLIWLINMVFPCIYVFTVYCIKDKLLKLFSTTAMLTIQNIGSNRRRSRGLKDLQCSLVKIVKSTRYRNWWNFSGCSGFFSQGKLIVGACKERPPTVI